MVGLLLVLGCVFKAVIGLGLHGLRPGACFCTCQEPGGLWSSASGTWACWLACTCLCLVAKTEGHDTVYLHSAGEQIFLAIHC